MERTDKPERNAMCEVRNILPSYTAARVLGLFCNGSLGNFLTSKKYASLRILPFPLEKLRVPTISHLVLFIV